MTWASEMLPLLGLDTGVKHNDQELRERSRARDNAIALREAKKAISKANRLIRRRQNRSLQLEIKGPVPLGQERDAYIDQIFEDLDSICAREVEENYVFRNMFQMLPRDIPMGYPGNPFLWVITYRHAGVDHDDDEDEEDDQLMKETVIGFAIATRLKKEEGSTFDLRIICSQRGATGGMGIKLFKHILRFAIDKQVNPDSLFANVFTLEPINRTVSQLYEDAAQEVLGRPLLYMPDGHLLVVLNDSEAVRGVYNDHTISREDFYAMIG